MIYRKAYYASYIHVRINSEAIILTTSKYCSNSEFTYVVHLEAINCLLILLSVQLFSQTAAEYSCIYRIVMHSLYSKQYASGIVCTLLHNFVQQEHAPPGLLTQQPGGSIVFSIAGMFIKSIKTIYKWSNLIENRKFVYKFNTINSFIIF